VKAFFRRLFCWHDWSDWYPFGHAYWSDCTKKCGATRSQM
jgi:hypothetical protein